MQRAAICMMDSDEQRARANITVGASKVLQPWRVMELAPSREMESPTVAQGKLFPMLLPPVNRLRGQRRCWTGELCNSLSR